MESKSAEVMRRFAKYVFLDVVGFSKRSGEAQSDVVAQLNGIVRSSLKHHGVEKENDCILIPTGDGMCLALIGQHLPYDVHIQMALRILKLLAATNTNIRDETREFEVRIGINQNTDILVTDINDRQNVAGAGINMAARIMDQGDGNQILVSRTVFDELEPSENYKDKFRVYQAQSKHGLTFPVYQFAEQGHVGLNVNVPTVFIPAPAPVVEPVKLDRFMAYYFAHAIKHKAHIVQRCNADTGSVNALAVCLLLYFLAKDSVGKSEASEFHQYQPITQGAGQMGFPKQLDYYCDIALKDIQLFLNFCELLMQGFFEDYKQYMVNARSSFVPVYIKDEGVEKLKNEWPVIWWEMAWEMALDNISK